VQCALSGAKNISVFNIKDPFFDRAVKMAENVTASVPGCNVKVYDLADEELLIKMVGESDVFVNASRAGIHPNENEMPIKSTAAFHEGLVVCDTVYNPRETKFLSEAQKCGCKTIGGVGMLIYQGAAALKLFTGGDMPVDEVNQLFFS